MLLLSLIFIIWLIFLSQRVSLRPIVKSVVHPYSIAIDAQSGNIFFTETTTNKIFKFDIHNNETSLYKDLSSFVKEIGTLAFNSMAELFVTDAVFGAVLKVSEKGGIKEFSSNFAIPIFDIGFDEEDNLIVIESGVTKVSPEGKKTSLIQNHRVSIFGRIQTSNSQDSGLNMRNLIQGAQGMAFDGRGNLYISNTNFDSIVKITKEGEIYLIYSYLISKPRGITVDNKDNLYVANTYRGNEAGYILKITPDGKIIKITDTLHDLSHVEQIKWNRANGKIYAAAFGAKAILEIGNFNKNFNPFGKKPNDKAEIIRVTTEKTEVSKKFQEKYNIAYTPAELNNTVVKKIIAEKPYLQNLSQDKKEVIYLFPATNILKEWEIINSKASETEESAVQFETGEEKNSINIITSQEAVSFAIKHRGDAEMYGLAKHYYAARPFKLSFWIKASEPGCARGGVYRGNQRIMAWSAYNSFGPKKGYELVEVQNWFDKDYSLNGNVYFNIENNCEVEIVNPVLSVDVK